MNESNNPSASPREFLSNVERLLAPVYAECFSDETRKTRNLLLIVSAVLIFSALGLIAFRKDPMNVPTLGIPVTVTSGMRWVLVVLSGYLLVIHSVRSYVEWNLWRLRHQAPMMELSDLEALLSSSLAERSARLTSEFKLSFELFQKLWKMNEDPPELLEATRRRDVLYKEHKDEPSNGVDIFDEFMRLDAEVKRLREEHEARTAPEREDLERRWRDVGKAFDADVAEPDPTRLGARLEYLKDATRHLKRIKSIRFGLEVLFPTAFAIVAILTGLFARS